MLFFPPYIPVSTEQINVYLLSRPQQWREYVRAPYGFFQMRVQRLQSSVTEQTVVKHQRPAGNLLHTKHLLDSKLLLLMEVYLPGSLLSLSLILCSLPLLELSIFIRPCLFETELFRS